LYGNWVSLYSSVPQDIIAHSPGMVFHVINLVVMVLMPMVVIHVKDSGFSLGKHRFTCRFTREFRAPASASVYLEAQPGIDPDNVCTAVARK